MRSAFGSAGYGGNEVIVEQLRMCALNHRVIGRLHKSSLTPAYIVNASDHERIEDRVQSLTRDASRATHEEQAAQQQSGGA